MEMTRRDLLRAAAVGATAFLVPGAARHAHAATGEPVLVTLFLRGAADGLQLVVPHGDPHYYALRPTIGIPHAELLDLDGFFGLHPALAPLLPLYQSGRLAAVHACGSTHPTRSHFDAQDFMERGAPGDFTVHDGWLNRVLQRLGAGSSLAAVSLGQQRALALEGTAPSLAFASLDDFRLRGSYTEQRRAALEGLYRSLAGTLLGRSGAELFDAVDVVSSVPNDSTVDYGSSGLGRALRDAAALVRADVGVRIVTIDAGGWDHHDHENDALQWTAADLAHCLAAFHADLGSHAGRTLVVTMTEFGRTAAENGALGTEHGHGSVSFVMGGGVHGGRVLVRDGWPGLAPAALHEGRDLAVTTDFRDLLAELVARHLGLGALGPVFPGHAIATGRFPGLFA